MLKGLNTDRKWDGYIIKVLISGDKRGMIGILILKNKIEQTGVYKLLKEPYCRKCATPGFYTKKCFSHKNMYGFHRAYAMGVYRVVSAREQESDLLSLHIDKLKENKEYAVPLGKALALVVKTLYRDLTTADFIVPVPIHPGKYKKRGFNQAYELGRVLEKELRITLLHTLLKLSDVTTHKLNLHERRKVTKNLYGIYNQHKEKIKGKAMILIDDILTTGLTVSECAQVLLETGAKHVDVLVLARNVY